MLASGKLRVMMPLIDVTDTDQSEISVPPSAASHRPIHGPAHPYD
jgi:hypothetical protein